MTITFPPPLQIPELVQPLVRTLAAAFSAFPASYALLAHQTRSRATDALLWALLAEAGVAVTPIPHDQHHDVYQHPDILIYKLQPAHALV